MITKSALGTSAQEFSRIIYGAWRLGDDKDTSKAAIQAKIEACLDVGMTTFDHADIYGDYECERLFGHAFKEMSEAQSITQHITKCDIALISEKHPGRRVKYYDTSGAYIQQSVENSLALTGVEIMDMVLIHRPDPFMDADETGAALDALIDSGKTRAVGVSNFKPHDWNLLQSRMTHSLQTNQIEISLLANEALTNGDLAFMQQHSISPMAWSPLAGGALFGDTPAAKRLLPKLNEHAAAFSVDASAVALAWLMAHPAGIFPVVGTNNLDRIRASADAMKVTLSRHDWFELYELACGHEVP